MVGVSVQRQRELESVESRLKALRLKVANMPETTVAERFEKQRLAAVLRSVEAELAITRGH